MEIPPFLKNSSVFFILATKKEIILSEFPWKKSV